MELYLPIFERPCSTYPLGTLMNNPFSCGGVYSSSNSTAINSIENKELDPQLKENLGHLISTWLDIPALTGSSLTDMLERAIHGVGSKAHLAGEFIEKLQEFFTMNEKYCSPHEAEQLRTCLNNLKRDTQEQGAQARIAQANDSHRANRLRHNLLNHIASMLPMDCAITAGAANKSFTPAGWVARITMELEAFIVLDAADAELYEKAHQRAWNKILQLKLPADLHHKAMTALAKKLNCLPEGSRLMQLRQLVSESRGMLPEFRHKLLETLATQLQHLNWENRRTACVELMEEIRQIAPIGKSAEVLLAMVTSLNRLYGSWKWIDDMVSPILESLMLLSEADATRIVQEILNGMHRIKDQDALFSKIYFMLDRMQSEECRAAIVKTALRHLPLEPLTLSRDQKLDIRNAVLMLCGKAMKLSEFHRAKILDEFVSRRDFRHMSTPDFEYCFEQLFDVGNSLLDTNHRKHFALNLALPGYETNNNAIHERALSLVQGLQFYSVRLMTCHLSKGIKQSEEAILHALQNLGNVKLDTKIEILHGLAASFPVDMPLHEAIAHILAQAEHVPPSDRIRILMRGWGNYFYKFPSHIVLQDLLFTFNTATSLNEVIPADNFCSLTYALTRLSSDDCRKAAAHIYRHVSAMSVPERITVIGQLLAWSHKQNLEELLDLMQQITMTIPERYRESVFRLIEKHVTAPCFHDLEPVTGKLESFRKAIDDKARSGEP